MQIKKSVVIIGLAVLLLVPFASAGFFDFMTGRQVSSSNPENVTVSIESSQATVITAVNYQTPFDLAGGTTKTLTVNFTAEDQDGSDDISIFTGMVKISHVCQGSTTTRSTAAFACVNTTPSELNDVDINFTCPVTFQYFDCNATDWIVNVSVNFTHDPYITYNDTTRLAINNLDSVFVSPNSTTSQISFPALSVFSTNKTSLINTTINNTGNTVPSLIQINATNLHGDNNSAVIFNASFFRADTGYIQTVPKANPCGIGSLGPVNSSQLQNKTFVMIARTTAPFPVGYMPQVQTNGGIITQLSDVRYCIPGPVPSLERQNYTTNQEGPWNLFIDFPA